MNVCTDCSIERQKSKKNKKGGVVSDRVSEQMMTGRNCRLPADGTVRLPCLFSCFLLFFARTTNCVQAVVTVAWLNVA